MSQLYGGGQEPDDAQDRIDRIRRGGASQPPQPEPMPEPEPTRVPSRATGSSRRMSTDQPRSASRSRGGQAVLFIGAIVGIGVLVVLGLVLFNMFAGGGGGQGLSLPFSATDTPTPTATFTPTPTPTETPTPTATPEPPDLTLPPLACIFQSGEGCFDYCAKAENEGECTSARDFITAQDADPDVWFECLSPGSGENVGNPQQCLEQAWFANNQ